MIMFSQIIVQNFVQYFKHNNTTLRFCQNSNRPAVPALQAQVIRYRPEFVCAVRVVCRRQVQQPPSDGSIRCRRAILIVCDDANIDTAIEGAFIAKMRNAGESCIAANRLYVHDSIYDEFCRRLVERFADLKVGNGLEDDVDVGPIISRKELEKLQAIVAEAVEDGAVVETGGTTLYEKGFFFAPTVLSNVKPGARILDREVFGPIAPLVRFRDVESVIQQANDTTYGLAAYVFSQDVGKAMRIAQRLNAGIVGVNRGFVSDPAAPFGGMKESGIGREGAQDGIKEFLETQYIATSW